MKKKLLFCGATHGSNFGDSLFAYMFKKVVESKYKDIEVIFTRSSEYSKEKLGLRAATVKDLFDASGMVYISGGYFGESHNESVKGSIYRFLTYFSYGLFMSFRKKPIAILGVGAGPLNRNVLKKAAVYLFNKSKIVSVRDDDSKKYMENYGVRNNIIVSSDSAQAIQNEVFGINYSNCDEFKNEKISDLKKILIHITEAPGKEIYFEKVIKAICESSLYTNKNCGFIITGDTTIKTDYLEKVYNVLPKDRTIVYDFNDPIDFLNVLYSVDSIITPKLHVGILGCTYGKAVLSFPIHPEKTTRYYRQIGFPERCNSLYKVSKDEVKELIEKYIFEKITLSDEIKNKALMNFQLLNQFIEDYM